MLLGYTHVPAIVKNCTMQESAVLALIENLQRQDLDIFDQAEGISRLISYWGVTQEEAAAKLGLAQSCLLYTSSGNPFNPIPSLRMGPPQRGNPSCHIICRELA